MGREPKTSGRSRASKAWAWLRPRVLPTLLVLLGVGALAWISVRATDPVPPSAPEQAILVLVSSALNISGGALYARIGRAYPQHARTALRNLRTVGRTVSLAINEIDFEIEAATKDVPMPSRIVRAYLETVKLHLADSMQAWNEVHPEALRQLMDEIEDK